jgi:DNA-nicking Smr family endonuclease
MSNKSFVSRPFEKLKKQIARGQNSFLPARPASEEKKESTDEELFASAMDDVHAIDAFRNLSCVQYHPKEQPTGHRRDPDHDAFFVLDKIAAGHHPISLPDTQEYVEWANSAYQDSIIAQLHQGRFSVQAFLDLHGFTVAEAEAEVETFLQESFTKGLACVKIIHGRGLRSVKGPRIKDAVVRRLAGRHRKNIIAFASARQCDGGLGALYVLLAKRKKLP